MANRRETIQFTRNADDFTLSGKPRARGGDFKAARTGATVASEAALAFDRVAGVSLNGARAISVAAFPTTGLLGVGARLEAYCSDDDGTTWQRVEAFDVELNDPDGVTAPIGFGSGAFEMVAAAGRMDWRLTSLGTGATATSVVVRIEARR